VRFPLPIVGARGHVQLRDDVVSIEDVHGQIAPEAGGGEVSMSGRVDPHGSGVDQVSIDLEAHPLAFTPALRAAVSELVHDQGELYDRFQPTGAAAVRLRVRPRSDPDGDWQVRIEPLGAEMTWAGFPLPLPNLTGSVRARPEGLDLDLAARRDGASVQVQGMLHAPPEHPGSFTTGGVDVRVRADAVPIDAYLRGAATHLSPQLQTVFDELSPTGTCSADLTVHRDRGDDEFVYDLALQLAGGTALPKALPMLVTALHGDVFVHGIGQQTEVQVDTVRGHLQERDGHAAELAVIGTVHTGPTYAEDLTAAVRFLELDPELGRVLEAGGQVGKGTWSVLVPSGKVDVVCRQFREGKVPPQHTYTVLMRDVRSDAEMLPQPATEITGELDVTASALAFHDLRARVGKSLVTCSSGRVGPADDGVRTKVEFSVSAERFPLDDNFSHLFLGPLRQAVVERQLHGAINVNGLSLQFLLPAEGTEQPIETILQGNVEALGVEVLLGTRLAGINGVVRLDESHVTRDGGTLRGNMTRGSFSILGHPCLDAQADFVADADRFVLRDLAFQMHGGKISTRPGAPESLVYVLAKNALDPGRLSTDLEIQGLSLSEFLHDSGFVDAPYSGTVNGWIRLNELRGTDLVHVDAAGELKVVDGNLGTVPLFTSIYALMAEVNRPRFDGMSVKFQVKDRVLALNDLVVGSPLVSVRGEGTMTMEGYLYIVLTTGDFFGGDADPVFIPWLLKLVTSNLVRFHLFGYLRDLHAEKRWIAQHNPRRQRLMPVAPRMDRPRRPDF
jgi:hypothetical protein